MIYSGKDFIVREWQKGDEPFLAHHANNKNIWRNLDDIFPSPYTYDDATVFVDDNLKNSTPDNFALVVDDEPIGNISIVFGKGVYKSSVNIRCWISEEYWGQGISTEAIGWLVKYCFKNNSINRIFALVFSNNNAAKQVLIRNDFKLEATFEDAILKEGIVYDELVYVIKK